MKCLIGSQDCGPAGSSGEEGNALSALSSRGCCTSWYTALPASSEIDNAALLLSSLPYTHPHITLLPTYSLLPGTPCLHRSAHSANPRWSPFPRSFPQPHLWRPLRHKITYSPGLCVRMKTSFGSQLWGIVNSAYQSLGTNIAKRTTWKDRVSL